MRCSNRIYSNKRCTAADYSLVIHIITKKYTIAIQFIGHDKYSTPNHPKNTLRAPRSRTDEMSISVSDFTPYKALYLSYYEDYLMNILMYQPMLLLVAWSAAK